MMAAAPTNYIMTCIDGTTFELPADGPVWSDELQALTIGGVEADAIYRDPSLMPDEFRGYEVSKVREVSEVDEVPPGKSRFYLLEIHAASELLPPLKTTVIGGDGEGWDFVERYGSDIDWGWQNNEAIFKSKGSISHWFYCPQVSEVREVSEVDDVPPSSDVLSELDGLRADVEWLKKEVRRVDWKDAYK